MILLYPRARVVSSFRYYRLRRLIDTGQLPAMSFIISSGEIRAHSSMSPRKFVHILCGTGTIIKRHVQPPLQRQCRFVLKDLQCPYHHLYRMLPCSTRRPRDTTSGATDVFSSKTPPLRLSIELSQALTVPASFPLSSLLSFRYPAGILSVLFWHPIVSVNNAQMCLVQFPLHSLTLTRHLEPFHFFNNYYSVNPPEERVIGSDYYHVLSRI